MAHPNAVGVCTNATCARAGCREPTEIYPGPGQYCPECGEELQPHAADPLPPAPAPRLSRRTIVAAAGIALVLAASIAAAGIPYLPAFSVRLCSTTMTDRAAREIVRSYAAQHRVWPYRVTVTAAGDLPCDVRFAVAPRASDDASIARDGVVAIVNPQNPVARIGTAQLRDVLAGRITDWSQLGGPRGPIVAAVPADGSDEAHATAASVMSGQPFGAHVVRTLPAAGIVAIVSSPSGRGALGLVPFSTALPAKVIALGDAPAPSTLSISDGRYPLAVSLTAQSDFRFPSRYASALIAFTHSADANDLFVRTAYVTKGGL